jgi:hypothetical protein
MVPQVSRHRLDVDASPRRLVTATLAAAVLVSVGAIAWGTSSGGSRHPDACTSGWIRSHVSPAERQGMSTGRWDTPAGHEALAQATEACYQVPRQP